MAYQRKTKDEYQLQANYKCGDGWEVVLTEDTKAEALEQKKSYLANMPEYPYKVVKKRVPINQ